MILQLQKSQPAPDVCLIGFSGKLMMGNESRQVEWNVAELLGAGTKKIIFDLRLSNLCANCSKGILECQRREPPLTAFP